MAIKEKPNAVKKHESKIVSPVREGKAQLQAFSFVDNRKSTKYHEAIQKWANWHSNKGAHGKEVIQAVKVSASGDGKLKKIRAEEKASEFLKEGSSAKNFGWNNVAYYQGFYSILIPTPSDPSKASEIKNQTPVFNNDFTRAEAGHVLAQRNSGDGSDPLNVFGQDGGMNNATWKAFEGKFNNDLRAPSDPDKAHAKFGVNLHNKGEVPIINGPLDRGEEVADDISEGEMSMHEFPQ